MFFSSRALLTSSLCSGLSLLALAPSYSFADTSDDLMNRSTLTGNWGANAKNWSIKGLS